MKGQLWQEVFPTHVGMNRTDRRGVRCQGGVPHACGDEPRLLASAWVSVVCSPRMWG